MPSTSEQIRSYAAAHFILELDGEEEVSLFRSIEGGGVKLDVMTYNNQVGKTYQRFRQLAKPKYEDIKLQVGMAMSDPFWNWVERFFTGEQDRKTGAIIAADFYYKERARRHFKAGMIRELTFPKLDASDKSPVYMNIGISVEDMEFVAGSGNKIKMIDPKSPGFQDQKMWTACNFEFTLHGIDGIDLASTKVTKIESFTIKQNIIEYHMGGQLSPIKTPSTIDFPNLTFYLPEAHAQPFVDYFTAKNKLWQQNDKAGNSSPLHGSIICNDAQHNKLCELTFLGADIVGVTPDRMDATSEEIKMVKVEMYTESMTFAPGAGAASQAKF